MHTTHTTEYPRSASSPGYQAVSQAGDLGYALGQSVLQHYPSQYISCEPRHYGYDTVPENAVAVLADCITQFAAELLHAYHCAGSERDVTAECLGPHAEAAVRDFAYTDTMRHIRAGQA